MGFCVRKYLLGCFIVCKMLDCIAPALHYNAKTKTDQYITMRHLAERP